MALANVATAANAALTSSIAEDAGTARQDIFGFPDDPRQDLLIDLFDTDVQELANFLFSPETFQTLTGIVFFLSFWRGVGTLVAAAIYNLAVLSASGEALAALESLDFYFNTQNIASQTFFNFSAWAIYTAGRLAINFFFNGPVETIIGIRSMNPIEVLKFLFAPAGAANFITQLTVEGFSLVLGWMLFGGIGQLVFGFGDQKKKREAGDEPADNFADVDDLETHFESNLNKIVDGISS